jgi:hypothetical protein
MDGGRVVLYKNSIQCHLPHLLLQTKKAHNPSYLRSDARASARVTRMRICPAGATAGCAQSSAVTNADIQPGLPIQILQ